MKHPPKGILKLDEAAECSLVTASTCDRPCGFPSSDTSPFQIPDCDTRRCTNTTSWCTSISPVLDDLAVELSELLMIVTKKEQIMESRTQRTIAR
jgi:hypothetical protein